MSTWFIYIFGPGNRCQAAHLLVEKVVFTFFLFLQVFALSHEKDKTNVTPKLLVHTQTLVKHPVKIAQKAEKAKYYQKTYCTALFVGRNIQHLSYQESPTFEKYS